MIEQHLNKIYNIDCLEFMKTLPDKCIDLVLTDPPYGIGIGGKVGGQNHSVKVGGVNLSSPKVIGDLTTHKSPQKKYLKK